MITKTEFEWWSKRDTDGNVEQGPHELKYENRNCDELHWCFLLEVEFDEEVPTKINILEADCCVWFQGKDYGDQIDNQNESRKEFVKRIRPLLDQKAVLKHAIVARERDMEAERDYQIDCKLSESRMSA